VEEKGPEGATNERMARCDAGALFFVGKENQFIFAGIAVGWMVRIVSKGSVRL